MKVDEMLRFIHDRPMTGEARDLAVKQARERGGGRLGDTGTVYGPFTTSEIIRLLLAGSHWPMRWFKRRGILKEMIRWEQVKKRN